jgi:putative peptidoglycan lipid II flippase
MVRRLARRLRRGLLGIIALPMVLLLVRVASVARDLLIGRLLGATIETDAFYLGLATVTTVASTLGTSLGTPLVPMLTTLQARRDDAAASRFAGDAVLLSIGCGFAAMVLLLFARGTIVRLVTAQPQHAELQSVLTVLAPAVLFSVSAQVCSAILSTQKKFLVPAATAALPAMGAAAALTVIPTAASLAVGFSIGALVEWSYNLRLARKGGLTFGEPKGVVRRSAPLPRRASSLVVASSLAGSTILVDTAMAGHIGEGAVTRLTLGNRVAAAAIAVIAAAMATLLLPKFSSYVSARAWADLKRLLVRYTAIAYAVSIPVCFLVFVFSVELAELMFRGDGLNDIEILRIAFVQQMSVLQVPFYLAGVVSVRVLHAHEATNLFVPIGVMNLSCNVIGNLILIPVLGEAGIALATAIGYVVSSVVTLILAWRRTMAAPNGQR